MTHLSPDAPAVNISLNGKQPVKELSYPNFAPDAAGNYLEIAPGDYDINVGPGALEIDFEAVAGKKVTAYVIGNADPNDAPMNGPLADIAQDDAELSAVTSVEATNPAGTGELPGDGDDDDE